ncbi:MAG: hypothetical protein E7C49_15690 [Clostridium sp.]|nr:hypothetical protein [Clostridium sp.]
MVMLLILPFLLSFINILVFLKKKKTQKNETNSNRILSSLLFIISILIIIVFLYIITSFLLVENDLLFRGWVNNLCSFLGVSIGFLIIFSVNYFLFKVMRKSSIPEEMYDGSYDKYDRIE